MKKILLTALFLLAMTLCSSANPVATAETTEPSTEAFDTHFGTMWDLSIGKKLGIVRLSLQQSVFTIDTSMERAMTIFGVDTEIIPTYLKVTALGFYLYHRGDAGNYRHLLRYHAGLNGAVPFKPLNLTWGARYESTYIVGNSTPVNKLRTRIRLVGNIPNSKFAPFLGSEHFLQLNGTSAGYTERIWIDLGVTYKIDKNNTVEFLIREENRQLATPQQWNTNIGFAYKVNL
ncbi:MAG: DUF2490 domain-containing protein [Bacteroidaceae bacterium]|nr:DUF2490 domain-containing protein [Bacteroidaceae bacterium]